jgi:CelD/BcsL family acetyltransferase involved in cellulose biosynthesis
MVVLRVERALGPAAAAWDRLVDQAPLPSPFLRSWWLSAMAGPESRYLLVAEEGTLLGGLAVDVSRRGGVDIVRPLGERGFAPDHLDLVALPDRADDVAAAVLRWLRRPGSRLLDVPGLADSSRLGGALGVRGELVEIEQAPWVPLPGDYATFLRTTLPGIMRNSIRRSGSKLARGGGEVRFVPLTADDPALDAVLARLLSLHAAQFGDDSALIRESARFRSAVVGGLACGEMKIFPLYVGDAIAAVDVAFSVAGRFSYYQGGRSTAPEHSGAGTVLMARGIEWACDTGHREVDFLRGAEPYKLGWGAQQRRPVLRLRAGFGPGGVAAHRLLQVREDERVLRQGRRAKALTARLSTRLSERVQGRVRDRSA